jgi:hypothetical protein
MQGKPEKVEKYRNKLSEMNYSGEEFIKKGDTYHKQWQNMPHYAAMVESMDENIGRLLQVLEQENLSGNTIVVFTSDNGGMSTSNRTDNIPTTNLPLRAGKGYLYEGGIREPLIFSGPGKLKLAPLLISGNRDRFVPYFAGFSRNTAQAATAPGWHQFDALAAGRNMDERPLFWHYPHYSGGLGGRPSGAVRWEIINSLSFLRIIGLNYII